MGVRGRGRRGLGFIVWGRGSKGTGYFNFYGDGKCD